LAVCLLLLLLFLCDFFYQWYLAKIFWIKDAHGFQELSETQDYLSKCFVWRVVSQAFFLSYSIIIASLVIHFLQKSQHQTEDQNEDSSEPLISEASSYADEEARLRRLEERKQRDRDSWTEKYIDNILREKN